MVPGVERARRGEVVVVVEGSSFRDGEGVCVRGVNESALAARAGKEGKQRQDHSKAKRTALVDNPLNPFSTSLNPFPLLELSLLLIPIPCAANLPSLYFLGSCNLTVTVLPNKVFPSISNKALLASSSFSKETKPNSFERPRSSVITLAETMEPKGEKKEESWEVVIVGSRDLMKRLPLCREGKRERERTCQQRERVGVSKRLSYKDR